MEVKVYLKANKDPLIFKGERIDILDFNMEGKKYKQIRYFRKGFSKSEYILEELIKKIS